MCMYGMVSLHSMAELDDISCVHLPYSAILCKLVGMHCLNCCRFFGYLKKEQGKT